MAPDSTDPGSGTPPELVGGWLRPSAAVPAEPRWGHPRGMQVGLHPLGGPRGLLRVYAPYLEHDRDRLVNFIAIEPIAVGGTARGYSELERSALDDAPGKRFWSSDDRDDAAPASPSSPARGVVDEADGVERLTVIVHAERFENGVEASVRVRFRADRPHEVALATLVRPGSTPVDRCILSATMGNYARLRRLELADRVVTPAELWPGFVGTGFTEHAGWGPEHLRHVDGEVVVQATPDEVDLGAVAYSGDTAEHWKYAGRRAAQGWRARDPSPQLRAQANARWSYWASASPIPGGPAYENLELVEPFRDGREFTFFVEPMPDAPA